MKRFITLLLFVASLNLFATEFNPFDGPKPIAVLIQTDPWASVIGAETPRVAVYEDGMVIFRKQSEKGVSYHRKDLSASELSDFKLRLTNITNVKELKRFYSLLPHVTDQPEAIFYIREEARELTTRVYGIKAAGRMLPYTVLPGNQKPDEVPEALLELSKYLYAVDFSGSQEWTPRYLEVMIWPYENAPEASIFWPKDWPGLDSKSSFKRGDSYSIFLDGSMLPELRKFLSTRKERGAVKIGGKKWAVSFRSVFPSEPMWRKALEKDQSESK
jgi:hypothetical protein